MNIALYIAILFYALNSWGVEQPLTGFISGTAALIWLYLYHAGNKNKN